jgi:hypothetical protein
MMNFFNNFIPFIVNLLSSIILLIQLATVRQRSSTWNRAEYYRFLRKQVKKNKVLLIAPIFTLLVKCPIILVTVLIRCLDQRWHLYLALVVYAFSLLPLSSTFFVYVWPSPYFIQVFYRRLNGLISRE